MTEATPLPTNETQRPGLVTTLAALTLTSGIINVFFSLAITGLLILATLGIGLVLCAPFTLLPVLLGIFEIIYGARLLSSPLQPPRPNHLIAYLEIATLIYFNPVGLAVGIIALVIYNDETVKEYFSRAI
jgi:ABC-type polysaccharide/polyol phosphate export permease